MKYQLVIQFPGESEDDFDHLIEIEDEFEEKLTDSSVVDGHDFGSGEMNIFILTNEPVETFKKVKTIIDGKDDYISVMRAAYRDIESEVFTILWPNDLTKFVVT